MTSGPPCLSVNSTGESDKRLLIVIDNAFYNHASAVAGATKATYPPNLNLIERSWESFKGKVARKRYHATFAEFRAAVQEVLSNLPVP